MTFTAADVAQLWKPGITPAQRAALVAAIRTLPRDVAVRERDYWFRLAARHYPLDWPDVEIAQAFHARLLQLRDRGLEVAQVDESTLDGALTMALLLSRGFVPAARSIRRALGGLAS